jgi:hypothetical protein
VLLREHDEFPGVLDRQGRVHDQHAHLAGERGHADEIAQGVVRQALVEMRVGHVGGRLHHDRVAVIRALGHHVGAYRARRAAAVLDHEILARHLVHLGEHDARGHIVGPPGREHDDYAHRLRRVGLSQCRQRGQQCGQDAQKGNTEQWLHSSSLSL